MLNNFILVGRLTNTPTNPQTTHTTITLAVNRAYKNENGMYDTDFIQITLPKNITNTVMTYCTSGDMIGIKGRIETKEKNMILIADRVTFLSASKQSNPQPTTNPLEEGEI